MNRLHAVWDTLGMKSPRHAVVYGLACGLLGATFALLCLTLYVEVEVNLDDEPQLIGAGASSDLGLVGEAASTELPAAPASETPAAFVPLHERSDYRVQSPDVLWVELRPTGPDSQAVASKQTLLVDTDGRLDLGEKGRLYVEGSTLAEIEAKIVERLAAPEGSLAVFVTMYQQNSHVYYVILEGQGPGDTVRRFPVCGNETVLDALSQVKGLGDLDKTRVWIARKRPGSPIEGVLAVKWTERDGVAVPENNYSIEVGDRIFVQTEKQVAAERRRVLRFGLACFQDRIARQW